MVLLVLPSFKSVVRNQFVGIVVGEKKGKVVGCFCCLFVAQWKQCPCEALKAGVSPQLPAPGVWQLLLVVVEE
jgi:hypothetical protein